MSISVADRGRPTPLALTLRALVRGALAGEGLRAGEISVTLADDATLRRLNREWRGIDRTTDVLSFAYAGDPRAAGGAASGDVVVSLDRVAVQARRYRVSRGRELARLVVHGALHLAGRDHRTAPERRAMRARERRALRAAAAAVARLERALRARDIDRGGAGGRG